MPRGRPFKRHKKTIEEIAEAEFRDHAFHVAYNRLYASEIDHSTRFAKALQHSAKPIPERNRDLLMKWYRDPNRKGKTKHRATPQRIGEDDDLPESDDSHTSHS